MKKNIKNIEYKAILILILAVCGWLTTENSVKTGGAFLGLATIYIIFLITKYKITFKEIKKAVL
ncbi:MAG: hypothetical protein ACRCW1_00615 [Anaerotignaceae bacterium]